MKKMIMNLVAFAVAGAVGATAADAQRTVVRTTHTTQRTIFHRTTHPAARSHHRVCRVSWNRHRRIRTCHTW